MLPDRYLKHCALCPIGFFYGGVRLSLLSLLSLFVSPVSRNVFCRDSHLSLYLTKRINQQTNTQTQTGTPTTRRDTHVQCEHTLQPISSSIRTTRDGAPLPLQVKRKLEMSLRGNDKVLVCAIIAAAASATYRNVVAAIKMLPESLQSRIHLYDRSKDNVSTGYLGNNSSMGLEALRVIESGNATVEKVMSRMKHVDDRLYSLSFVSSNTVNRLAKWRPKLFWWLNMLPQLKEIKKGSGTMEDPFGVKDGYVFACGLYPNVVPPGKARDPRTKMTDFMR